MDDLEFVRRCVSGDKETWDEFVGKYSSLIYNYIYSVLASKGYTAHPELVNDLYQDVFAGLIKNNFKKLRQFKAKNGASLASWLRIITINFTLDFLRRKKPIVSLDEESKNDDLSLKQRIADNSSPNVSDVLLEKEKLEVLLNCVAQLEEDDKYFVDMHIYRDISLETLRQMFKISRSAIDMRKARIIKRLKECFRDKGLALDF